MSDDFDQLDHPYGAKTEFEASWVQRYPPAVRSAIARGAPNWQHAVRLAVQYGFSSPAELTDIAFYMHYPDLKGKTVPEGHPRIATYSSTWKRLNVWVRSLLGAGPSRGTTGTLKRFASIRRVWMHTNTIAVVKGASNPSAARRALCEMAPTDVVIGVNDASWARDAGRRNRPFRIYSSAKLNTQFMEAIDEIKSCGSAIHYMSWITPRRNWCQGMVDTMFELCARTGARSLLLDAEEPWTKVKPKTGPHRDFARDIFAPMIAGRPCCCGVTHIIARGENDYVFKKIAPLIAACDYHLPQAYTNGTPGKRQKLAVSRWKDSNKTFVMGLSAMNRVSSADMWQDLKTTDELGLSEVYYWSYGHLRSKSARKRLDVVKEASDLARSNHPELPPPPLCHIPWPLF
ncbi:hypothetical protein [Thioclava sp.]|uniref:hypothetical protein n=1 Tax=Thioclava sp. TaxID=1933450 RepID=UPI003AA909EE